MAKWPCGHASARPAGRIWGRDGCWYRNDTTSNTTCEHVYAAQAVLLLRSRLMDQHFQTRCSAPPMLSMSSARAGTVFAFECDAPGLTITAVTIAPGSDIPPCVTAAAREAWTARCAAATASAAAADAADPLQPKAARMLLMRPEQDIKLGGRNAARPMATTESAAARAESLSGM